MWSKTCLCASLLQRIIDLNRRGPVSFRMSSSQQSVSKCKTLEKAAVMEQIQSKVQEGSAIDFKPELSNFIHSP